jgi:type IV secretory pathway protease TraF
MLPSMSEAAEQNSELRAAAPLRIARLARRATVLIGAVAVGWFLWKFDTRWVPPGMNTNPDVPAGSWVLLDRYATGLRVGSDVFVETPHGELVSRVTALDPQTVTIRHPDPRATWGDSELFGPLDRSQVLGTIVVTLAPSNEGGRGR